MRLGVLQIAGWMAALALPLFVVGTAYRFVHWFRTPRSAVRLGLFAGPEQRWLKLGKDSFLFPQVLELDRRMWAFVIAFHAALLILLVGHLRLLFEFGPLARALGDRGLWHLAFVLGGIVGIVLVIAALYFLSRRLTPPVRQLSVLQDYLLLALVLLVVLSGCNLRFFGDVPVTVYRQYVSSALSFGPRVPAGLESATAQWSLGVHVMLASILIAYIPSSRLMHVISSLAANLIRGERLGSDKSHA